MRPIRCSWSELAARVADPAHRVRVIDEFIGYQHRPAGWYASNRHHGNHMHAVVLVESGRVTAGDPPRLVAGPGQAVLLGERPLGPVRFEPGVRFYEAWIGCFASRRTCSAEPGVVMVDRAADSRWLFERLATELLHAPRPDPLLVRSGAAMLLACLTRSGAVAGGGPRLSRRQRTELVRWTREHLAAQPAPADLARVVGLTPDYFARIFRATFGRPPRRWLVEERLRAAARLLRETDEPVARIAERCGFPDPSHFGRAFKRQVGLTPRAWRRG